MIFSDFFLDRKLSRSLEQTESAFFSFVSKPGWNTAGKGKFTKFKSTWNTLVTIFCCMKGKSCPRGRRWKAWKCMTIFNFKLCNLLNYQVDGALTIGKFQFSIKFYWIRLERSFFADCKDGWETEEKTVLNGNSVAFFSSSLLLAFCWKRKPGGEWWRNVMHAKCLVGLVFWLFNQKKFLDTSCVFDSFSVW